MEYIYSQESARVLVVDDEKVIRELLTDFLTSEGLIVSAVENGTKALEELENKHYDVLITDLKMPDLTGLEILAKVKDKKLPIVTIIMTGFGTVESAISAMKQGAYDYILKPFKLEELLQIVKRGLEKLKLERENIQLKEVMSLYQMCEQVSSSLDLEVVLKAVSETAIKELDADGVSIILEQPGEYDTAITEFFTFPELVDRDDEIFGVPDLEVLKAHFLEKNIVIAHGVKTRRFFRIMPERRGLSSIISVSLRAQEEVFGAVIVYSYRKNYRFSEGQAKLLVILADRAAQSIENARLYNNLRRTFRETIEGLVSALEAKDKYTSGHSRRVTEFALLIGRAIKLSSEELEKIERAALLHDIGKIGIRLEALNKPEKITKQEHEMFKDHTIMGKQILESVYFLREIVPLVYYHHEWYDGSGYPEGIKGEKIPLGARILAIADAYDAMTSDRPYRKALTQEQAIKELRRCAGTQFDPSLVEVFINQLEQNLGLVEKTKQEWMGISSLSTGFDEGQPKSDTRE